MPSKVTRPSGREPANGAAPNPVILYGVIQHELKVLADLLKDLPFDGTALHGRLYAMRNSAQRLDAALTGLIDSTEAASC